MMVSLEAIFTLDLRDDQPEAGEKRQILADHQWQTVQDEEHQNEDLLRLANQILELTRAIHEVTAARAAADPARTNAAPSQAPGPAEPPGS